MNTIIDGIQWLTTADNWTGRNGIGRAVLQHLWYSLIATVLAVGIALPIGLAIGHTGRGRFVVVNVSGIWRAIPTIGVVTIVYRWQPLSVWPVLIALVILAVPPIVLNTVAGIDSVPGDIRDAATGMGLTGWQALWHVEIPNGMPLILAGIRSAANQVIATVSVAGFVGLGTLGVFIFTASRSNQQDVMAGASIAIIILVLAVEGLFALLQRAIVSPGVRARTPGRLRRAATMPLAPEMIEASQPSGA